MTVVFENLSCTRHFIFITWNSCSHPAECVSTFQFKKKKNWVLGRFGNCPELENYWVAGHDLPQVFPSLTPDLHHPHVLRDYIYYCFENTCKLEIGIMGVTMSSCRPRSVSLKLLVYSCKGLDSLHKNSSKGKVSNILQLFLDLGFPPLDWDKLREEALIQLHFVYFKRWQILGEKIRVRFTFQIVGCIKREGPSEWLEFCVSEWCCWRRLSIQES